MNNENLEVIQGLKEEVKSAGVTNIWFAVGVEISIIISCSTVLFRVLRLLLVPNGESLGYWLGDANQRDDFSEFKNLKNVSHSHQTSPKSSHAWGIFFTVLGTVLLDFDADACQSPARAYLLDVCLPEDHARGLSTFTVMAGLGGFFGYSMGGLNWDETDIGRRLGGHVKAVFSIITIIFIMCVAFTITSFAEIPLWVLANADSNNCRRESVKVFSRSYGACGSDDETYSIPDENKQGASGEQSSKISLVNDIVDETCFNENPTVTQENTCEDAVEERMHKQNTLEIESLRHYLLSIIYMPLSLKMICITNLFCWMAHVCYSLYFTDFVGEAVFKGDPKATQGSIPQLLYEEGVRFGCWGMAMYSLSCASYSLIIEKLIQHFRAKSVYVGGLLFYCTGMALMALTRAKISVLVFSWTAGIMYSTLFTMPYLLVAHYHNVSTFELHENGSPKVGSGSRGLGTDIAIISSMVFLAQFILSLCMGTIIKISGTTTSVISTASFLSFCGALSATKIMYLDL
ncbi:proton-associated sugar transporter A [Drosophila elegans]|uniref:proton-associated sugar transporter A n=1 Tax=Drosophila elegans TaxID=30023 RepID=UPI001BC84CFE|nr:proton-associated sugar transporter A [Drosophila elegans]